MTTSHLTGAITTTLVHGVIAVTILGFSDPSGCDANAERGKLKMTSIEAALAYKSQVKSRQPQKRRKRVKRARVKPAGVSRDDQKKLVARKKKPAQTTQEDFAEQFEKYKQRRQRDDEEDDEPIQAVDDGSEAEQEGGSFDGSEHGFAEVSRGDPYMQQLAKDVYALWELPTLEKNTGTAVGCVRLAVGGRIVATKLETRSRIANLDRSVRVALDKLKKKRNKNPKKVPKHLHEITTQWTCFKLSV
ncbi:MAG: hypothetical protein MJE77_21515 [Proteobacteria bacterium]|nr:hypothetical protein [Pseudomonadota bacterium]